MKKTITLLALLLFVSAIGINAQVRPAESAEIENTTIQTAPRRMLESIKVKYKGGLYGFSKSQEGTLKFDDLNERLVFYSEKDGKEKFSIPYSTFILIYPSQRKVQSGTGRAIGAIPIPGAGIGGSFIKKKKNYLVIRFDDQDVKVQGNINFLVDTGDLLENAIYTIGEKAEMKRRGDAYIRRDSY